MAHQKPARQALFGRMNPVAGHRPASGAEIYLCILSAYVAKHTAFMGGGPEGIDGHAGGRAGNLSDHAVDRGRTTRRCDHARHSFIASRTDLRRLPGSQFRDDGADAVAWKVDVGDPFISPGNGLPEFQIDDMNGRSNLLHFLLGKKTGQPVVALQLQFLGGMHCLSYVRLAMYGIKHWVWRDCSPTWHTA